MESSPIIITSHHLRGFSSLVQPRSERKFFFITFMRRFCQVSMVLLWILPFWFRINFALRISVWKPVLVSCFKYACFHAYFCKSCFLYIGRVCDIVGKSHWSIIIVLISQQSLDYSSICCNLTSDTYCFIWIWFEIFQHWIKHIHYSSTTTAS